MKRILVAIAVALSMALSGAGVTAEQPKAKSAQKAKKPAEHKFIAAFRAYMTKDSANYRLPDGSKIDPRKFKITEVERSPAGDAMVVELEHPSLPNKCLVLLSDHAPQPIDCAPKDDTPKVES